MKMTSVESTQWYALCKRNDLITNSGVCAKFKDQQVALFFLPDEENQIFAISNYDPIGGAFVLSRGIVGDVKGELCVASPLYKQHFDLHTGVCKENPDTRVQVYNVRLNDDTVEIEA